MVVDPREQHLRRREDAMEAGRRWQEVPSSAAEARTYCTVTRRRVAAMQCLIASASSARGTRRLIGMSLQRGVRPLLERGRKWIAASRGQPRAQLGWRVCVLHSARARASSGGRRLARAAKRQAGPRAAPAAACGRAPLRRTSRRSRATPARRALRRGGMSRRMPSKAASPWQGERGRVHPRGRPARGSPVIKQRRDGREGSS